MAAEFQKGLVHKLKSQSVKQMKNRPRMPRTAGLKTLSDLSGALTKAGLDPSRIEERAAILAKAAGVKRKRQQEEDDAAMELDDDAEGGWEDEDGDAMDVDEGAGGGRAKRRKSEVTALALAKTKHTPKTDRQFVGMRDAAVSSPLFVPEHAARSSSSPYYNSKEQRQSGYGISANVSGVCTQRLERVTGLSVRKWSVA